MKKIITRITMVSLLFVVAFALSACNGNKKLSDADVEEMMKEFEAPMVIDATFTQDYELSINDDREFLQSFASTINDVVTIQIDFTENNIYYYGKRVSGDEVVEHLLVKEGNAYAYFTTTDAKQTLATDALAKEKVSELLIELSRQTAGYVDVDSFTYSETWIQEYVLLGSENVDYMDEQYFTYSFEKAKNIPLLITGTLDLIGYFGDMGTFEFGIDETLTGSEITIEANEKGQITNFEQTLSNHLDMALFDPAAPLDLNGTRTLVAEYGGTLNRKTEITQHLVTTATIALPEVTNGTITSYDFALGDNSTLETSSLTVTEGNLVAVKVELSEGDIDKVTVNGFDTELTYGYYVYMTPAVAGETYNVEVVLDNADATTGSIVLPSIDGVVVESFDFENNNFATLQVTSSTVTPGNFVAIKLTPAEGVSSVTVNDQETSFINGYYVYMTPAVAGETYTVVVNLD